MTTSHASSSSLTPAQQLHEFLKELPRPTLVEDYPSMYVAGMTCGAFNPLGDEPYLEARQKRNKLRSKLFYFILRKIDEKVSHLYQLKNKDPA